MEEIKNIPKNKSGFCLMPDDGGRWRLSGALYLEDKPGELADLSSFIALNEANIEKFTYNRSDSIHIVHVEISSASASDCGFLADGLRKSGYLDEPEDSPEPELWLTDPEGLLKIRATLEDKPGELAALAGLLKTHGVSVIYMSYDGEKAPGMAEMTMAARSAMEVSGLLDDLNRGNYHYYLDWQGASGGAIDKAIGLSHVETFLFKLKAMLPPDRIDYLFDLIRSSDELRQTLIDFRREAGESSESMAASEVFTNILQLGASSIGRTGRNFTFNLTGPIDITEQVSLRMISCPTGANAYLLRHEDRYIIIDTGYGLYYSDAMRCLAGYGIDPSRITDALIGHPDADHAGWASGLEKDYGTRIHMHPQAVEAFLNNNRAIGGDGRLLALNGYFTRLICWFTDFTPPRNIVPFEGEHGRIDQFNVLEVFPFGDIRLRVLESLGGHVPAQVFFYEPDAGLLFTGDYLIDVPSLSDRAKAVLSIPRQLMTSTNNDSRLFSREMALLRELMKRTQRNLQDKGILPMVFPGHGHFYSLLDVDWK